MNRGREWRERKREERGVGRGCEEERGERENAAATRKRSLTSTAVAAAMAASSSCGMDHPSSWGGRDTARAGQDASCSMAAPK